MVGSHCSEDNVSNISSGGLTRDLHTVQAFDSNSFGDGAVLGCDFVGEVVKLGSEVTRLANHDIIAGLVWGGT